MKIQKHKVPKIKISLQILLLLTNLFFALVLVAPTANAALIAESGEIPYQVEHSDRIVVGTVTDIEVLYDHSVVTVEVHEWLMHPLQTDTIRIQTFIGTNVEMEDEVRFTADETVILMLKDEDLDTNTFRVTVGEPRKHPVSDKGSIVEEIAKVQGDEKVQDTEELPEGPITTREEAILLATQYADHYGIWIGDMEKAEILDNTWFIVFGGEDGPEQFIVYGSGAFDIEHWTRDEMPGRENRYEELIAQSGVFLAILVFIVSIVFLVAVGKKAIENPEKGKKDLLFFMIGIVTFFLSGYILEGIHPPDSFYVTILVFLFLFSIAIIFFRNMSWRFVSRTLAISLAALIVISGSFFLMSMQSHINAKYIDADSLYEEPDEFIVITEEEMNKYPALKEAIETGEIVQADYDEWERTTEFLTGIYAVQYKGEYYSIGFMTA
ncbi:hypothetical protein [Methanolobus sp. WCC4]|uniref:hypothetical protein n=1 Tax=Methanolobus sp. WCC4 TaxID=3125784 RepID=UPI0030FB757C